MLLKQIRKKFPAHPLKHYHILTLSHEFNLKEKNIGRILLRVQVVMDFWAPLKYIFPLLDFLDSVDFPGEHTGVFDTTAYSCCCMVSEQTPPAPTSSPISCLPLDQVNEETRKQVNECSDTPSMGWSEAPGHGIVSARG